MVKILLLALSMQPILYLVLRGLDSYTLNPKAGIKDALYRADALPFIFARVALTVILSYHLSHFLLS